MLPDRSVFSSGTDEVRAKREPSLCNESVKRHFWFFSNNAVWDEDGNLLHNPPLRYFMMFFLNTAVWEEDGNLLLSSCEAKRSKNQLKFVTKFPSKVLPFDLS